MTSWMDAIDKVRSLGYSVTLDGGKLRYTYQGKDNPIQEEITPLLEVLKVHKGEILNDSCFLIEQTLQEVNRGYHPGTVEWMKTEREKTWAEIRQKEQAINQGALAGDISGLRGSLIQYRELWNRVILDRKENIISSRAREATGGTGRGLEGTFKQGRLFSG